MKKIRNIATIILCIIFVPLCFFHRVNAQDSSGLPPVELLQTSPFYKIQQLRDRIIERLLVIPQVKLEYYLVMSEKKLHEYLILNSYGQSEKGTKSGAEGSNYLTKFVSDLSLYQQYLSPGLRDTLICSFYLSTKKQQTILTRLRDNETSGISRRFDERLLAYISLHEDKLFLTYGEVKMCNTMVDR